MPNTTTATASALRPHCPQCGGALRRARRRRIDRQAPGGEVLRGYQCRRAVCGWRGLVPRGRRASDQTARAALLGLLLQAAMVAVLAFGLPAAAVVVLRGLVAAEPAVPAGQSDDGRALPLNHALQQPVAAPAAVEAGRTAEAADPAEPQQLLALRMNCAWGQPGRNPYRGSTEQALRQARLPPEVVHDIADRRARGLADDRLEIRTASITAQRDGRQFNPKSFVMTYGRTLCLNARVNFAPGHVEAADLYESRDRLGRRYAVMVPDVCGNVSVLGARGSRNLRAADGAPWAALPWLQVGSTDDEEPALHTAEALPVHDVPEPGALGLALLALLGLGGATGLARRRLRKEKAAGRR